jgi:hypothetical protein
MLIAACASKPATETTETGTASAQQLVSADLDVVCQDTMVTGMHFPARLPNQEGMGSKSKTAAGRSLRGLQSDATRNLSPVPAGGFVN